MTDKHAGYVVTLGEDIREDDAAHTITALRMVKGVIDVKPIVGGIEEQIATARAKNELAKRLIEFHTQVLK